MTPPAADLNPVTLFLQADVVVKAVMLALLAASVWSWAIMLDRSQRLKRAEREAAAFEGRFWTAQSLDGLIPPGQRPDHPAAEVFAAGYGEWEASTAPGRHPDREGLRARLSAVLQSAIDRAVDVLSDRLNVLATVGSVAPFVGLFGTVWGIMRAFIAIGASQNTSLAVVAPGIAEALFATAIGLFAAIPAVIGYNRLLHRVNRLAARLDGFAGGLHALLSRQLDGLER